MQHISWAVPLLFVAGTAIGQSAAGVSVALTATAANETQVGNNILLSATVRTPGVGVMQPGAAAPRYARDRMRFTFKAQRTWPCPAAATTLAENVSATGGSSGTASVVSVTHTAGAHFVQPAAGEYTLSVDVTYVGLRKGSVATAPEIGLKPEKLGSATLKYKVKPQPGFSPNVLTSISPPSPATAPASVSLTVYFNNPPQGYWYRYSYSGAGSTATKDNQGASTTFQFQIPNPGQYTFSIGVDKVYQPTCTWQQSIVTHMSTPYYYMVKAPTP